MSSLAELKQTLKEDTGGNNLYEHITELLVKVLIEKPKRAYENFELLSAEVKNDHIGPPSEPVPPSKEEVTYMLLSWYRFFSPTL